MEIEHAYSELSEKEREHSHLSMQEKMLSFQRQCQGRANEQVRTEMTRFKERELSAMRLECESKMQDEVVKVRRQTETFFQERMKGLQQRERNLMEGMKTREAQLDATLFSQRQKILDELESVKNRECGAKRLLEVESKEVRGERERLMFLEQNLKLREINLESVNKQNETTSQQVLSAEHVRLQRDYESKLHSLEVQEAKLNEERRSLSQMEVIYSQQIKDATELRNQLFKLQEALHVSTESHLFAEKDKSILNEKLERMGDYQVLKSENIRLENELYMAKLDTGKDKAILEQKIRDFEVRISELKSKLHDPSDDLQELHDKFIVEKRNHGKERILRQQENKQLQSQLDTALYQQNCLKDTLRDHQLLAKQLNHELSELRVRTSSSSRVRETTQFDPPRIKSSLRSHTAYSAPPTYSPPKLQPDLLSRPKSSRVRIKLPSHSVESAFNDTMDVSQSGSEISFVQEAKSSLERLEREAQELEHSYKKVHNRILRGTAVESNNFIQDIHYTSTIDPNALLQSYRFQPVTESGREMFEKSIPSFSLTSLTDMNLTTDVKSPPQAEHDKSTVALSSCTTQDNFPSIPSITQLISNPIQSPNSRELSLVEEIHSYETADKLVIPANNSILDTQSVSPNVADIDPIKLFHHMLDTSVSEELNLTTNTIESIDLSSGLQLNETIIEKSPPKKDIPTDPILLNKPIEVTGEGVTTEANVTPKSFDNNPQAVQSTKSRVIPDKIPLELNTKDIPKAENKTSSVSEQEELTVSDTALGLIQTPDNLFEDSERSFHDNELRTVLKPSNKTNEMIIQTEKEPEKPAESEPIDPMAAYMQLLANSNPNIPLTKPTDEITEELDVSLREDKASYGAFSDSERSNPFKDW